ncbi:iron uptake porin [Leptolyngbya sp. FACHB-17]|uniref:iron uptake porin n=1 Tax=unclassified Leptolyngbya TaxID=2650499 RepID=UPI0016810254|nr:iron uptake porin [Leptolyngbya sp. FACHB-17]MBD2082905.1 iron uptake porin [Leptolyngbya sp. FACHB-17]
MRKILLNSLFTSPAVLGAALLMSSSVFAAQKTEVAGLPAVEVGTQSEANFSGSAAIAPLAEVKSLEAVKPQAQVSAEFSSAKSVVVNEPVKVAQAAPEAPATTSTDSLNQLNRYSREGRSMTSASSDQVTSVSQLSDVRPTDWAFQALQSLVERYGCIAGYPDRTFRGNRATTRFEFAAGLNACLNRINELIAASTADLVKKEDLATLQKLQEQFAAELATLRGRVDALEARTTTLEKQQFSTTTKLAGEGIFAITDEFGVRGTGGNNTVFQNRVRLALNTSFTGKDLLVTRIAAGNANLFAAPAGSGAEGIQTFNFGNTGGNQAFIDWVAYYFPVGENLRFYVPAVSGLHYDYAPTISPALDAADGGTGPLSVFAQRNPIYLIGGGSGIGATFNLNNTFQVSAGYLADNSTGSQVTFGANNPASRAGLFNGSYSALAQLTFNASDALQVGLTYVNAYRQGAIFDGGSALASSGTSLANRNILGSGASQVNAYGASIAFKLSPNIVLNAFGSYINANFVDDGQGEKDIWTYGAGLAFPDFGKKGNLLGFVAGVEPYVGNPGGGLRNDIPLHFEGFYKYQLNDNISITPGVIWIVNPGQNENNDDIVIGTIRTTFTF